MGIACALSLCFIVMNAWISGRFDDRITKNNECLRDGCRGCIRTQTEREERDRMSANEIEDLKNSLVEKLSPEGIYLFGSFAEGKQREDSDFDFYIVVDDSEKDMLALTAQAYKAIRHKQRRSVDIIVNTKSRFENRKNIPSVEREVAKKGVLLYER